MCKAASRMRTPIHKHAQVMGHRRSGRASREKRIRDRSPQSRLSLERMVLRMGCPKWKSSESQGVEVEVLRGGRSPRMQCRKLGAQPFPKPKVNRGPPPPPPNTSPSAGIFSFSSPKKYFPFPKRLPCSTFLRGS